MKDPHLTIEDVENMTMDEMKQRMKDMEDKILEKYGNIDNTRVLEDIQNITKNMLQTDR